MRQIFWVILIACAVLFGAIWYANRAKTRALGSGEVHVREGGPPAAGGDGAAAGAAETQGPAGRGAAPAGAAPESGQAAGGVEVPPAADSISRSAPNGMIFAGRGRYQLYRQGDITWRLNTDTGDACVLFATDTQWHKARVFEHGCGTS